MIMETEKSQYLQSASHISRRADGVRSSSSQMQEKTGAQLKTIRQREQISLLLSLLFCLGLKGLDEAYPHWGG